MIGFKANKVYSLRNGMTFKIDSEPKDGFKFVTDVVHLAKKQSYSFADDLHKYRKAFRNGDSYKSLSFSHAWLNKVGQKDLELLSVPASTEQLEATTIKDMLTQRGAIRNKLAEIRSQMRRVKVKTHTLGKTTESFQFEGGTYLKPGTFTRLNALGNIDSYFMGKAPKNNEHHIAVEIECYIPMQHRDFAKILINDVPGSWRWCEIKSDGSLRPPSGYTGVELVIISEQSRFFERVERICAVLNQHRAKINDACGLHVHLDMRNRDVAKCFEYLVTCQDYLLNMQPHSRRNNEYCKPNQSKIFNDTVNRSRHERYMAINDKAYSKHKTLEVRLHSGTTNAMKINTFVKLLLKIINPIYEFKRKPRSLESLKEKIALDDATFDYVKSRIEKFNDASVKDETA